MADSKEKEEQARKAHALAEKCFLAGNVSEARQWMQSAVRLAPDLPGTQQIVAAYDVHAAAASWSRRNWYGVLGLKPGRSLTHDDIKKQYRRLCLLVHPDKNPSAAADGAFKLIHAAWDALSAEHLPLGTAVPAPANQSAPPQQKQRQAAPPKPPKPQPTPKPPKTKPTPKPPKTKPTPKPPKPKPEPKPPKPEPAPKTPKPEPAPRPPKPEPTPRAPEPKPKPESYYYDYFYNYYDYCNNKCTRPSPQSTPEPPTDDPYPADQPKHFNKCSNCGAQSCNGRGNDRCGSCLWSPMDGRRWQPPHDDDDRRHPREDDDYYYDYYYGYYDY